MPKNTFILLGTKKYTVDRDSDNRLRYVEGRRPSQPGDGQRMFAEWQVSGPAFNSYEDLSRGRGLLSTCCNINTDGRWPNRLMLGPSHLTIDCDDNDSGDTVEDAHAYAQVSSTNDTFLYVLRGTRMAKIDLSDNTNEPAMNQLPEVGESIIATRAEDGSVQVSIGFAGNNEYKVITTPNDAGGGADTLADNDEGEEIAIFFQGDDRVFGLGGFGNTTRVAGNILTGTTDMKDSAWQEITTVDGFEGLEFTGGAMDKEHPTLGTTRGPMLLNARFGRFFFPRGAVSADDANCREMTQWLSPVNLSIPMKDGTLSQDQGSSVTWGITDFHRNESEIMGYVTGQAGSERWIWTAVSDVAEGSDTYIIAWRPTVHTDFDQEHDMQPFPIMKLDSINCKFIYYAGTVNGVRTSPTWYYGVDDDVGFHEAGRPQFFNKEFEDSRYRFTGDGTWAGTDMRRHENELMDFEAIELTTENCDENDLITPGFSTDGGSSYTDLSGTLTHTGGATLNGVIDTDGAQRVLFIDNSSVPLTAAIGKRTFKPRLTLDAPTASNSASPTVRGYLRLTYWLRPEMVNTYEVVIRVEDRHRTVDEVRDEILDLSDDGPQAYRDLDDKLSYVKVEAAIATYDRIPDIGTVTVRLTTFATASGD